VYSSTAASPRCFHIGQDVGHALLDGGVGVGRPMQALLKQGFKIGLGGGQAKWAGGAWL
jgi:hypothetical protein